MTDDRVQLDDPEQDSRYFPVEEQVELAFKRSPRNRARKKSLETNDES